MLCFFQILAILLALFSAWKEISYTIRALLVPEPINFPFALCGMGAKTIQN
jgi:hypothetical protein